MVSSMQKGLRELKIELTQRCPLACVHCSTSSHRRQSSSLPHETVVRLLREAAELGVKKVVFTGGEPLVYPNLREVISAAVQVGIQPTLYTTGILDDLLNPINAEQAADLVRIGISRFIFSVYSGSAAIHESITRYGTFAPTVSAITSAVATGVPVEMHFVAMHRNFRHLPDVVALAEGLGASRVSVLRFVPQGRGIRIHASEDLPANELTELGEMIERSRYRHPAVNIRAGSPLNVLGIGHTPCNAAQDVLIINHRGEIFPCDAFKNVSFSEPRFGSVLQNTLKDVWEKSLYLNTVRDILDRHSGESCDACKRFDGCVTGCLAQKVLREGWPQGIGERLVQIGISDHSSQISERGKGSVARNQTECTVLSAK
jgi:radical SAM protein with 4Fe4S-binding SPASM domain